MSRAAELLTFIGRFAVNTNSERGVATEPPPVIQFSATVTQWEIYDTYMADYKHMLEEVIVRVVPKT